VEGIHTVTENIDVRLNPWLADCSALCAMLDAGVPPAQFLLADNAFECSDLPTVEAYCDTVSSGSEPPGQSAGSEAFLLTPRPNPAATTARLDLPGKGAPWRVTIYNRHGQTVCSLEPAGEAAALPVHELPAGDYWLQARSLSASTVGYGRLVVVR
jgi:hypothetical protein